MFIDIRRPWRFILLVLVTIVACGTSSASYAQPSIPLEQAKAFVRAALAVSQVSEAWQLRIDEAKSEVEAERLKEQATLSMRQAIRDVDGMTMDQYRSVYHEAKRNPELAAYLKGLLEEEVVETVR